MQMSYSKGFFSVCAVSMIWTSLHAVSFEKFPGIDKQAAFSQEQDGLVLTVQCFTRDDCKKYFGKDLIALGYRPMMLEVVNRGNQTFVFDPSYTTLHFISSKKILDHLVFPMMTMLSTTAPLLLHYYWHELRPLFATVAMGMWLYNQKITRDLQEKCFDEKAIKVIPFGSVTRLVFCDETTFLSRFKMQFFNEDTKNIVTYEVDLLHAARKRGALVMVMAMVE